MKQTAIDWIINELRQLAHNPSTHLGIGDVRVTQGMIDELEEQAKQMEKEQIMKSARECHFEGVRQSAKTSEDYIAYGEQYYNETYKPNN